MGAKRRYRTHDAHVFSAKRSWRARSLHLARTCGCRLRPRPSTTDSTNASAVSFLDVEDSTTSTGVELEQVAIAARSSIEASPLWIADAQGFFTERGIEIVYVPVSDEPSIFAALASGEARGGITSATALLERARRSRLGLSLEEYIDGTEGRLREERGSLSLVAQIETMISRGCDLVGRKVGVDSNSSLSAVAVREMVIHDGCDATEVELVIADSETRVNSLGTGDLDAAALLDPFTTRVLDGPNKIVANLDNELCPDFGQCPLSIAVFRADWAENNADTVDRFRQAMREAMQWIRDNDLEYRAELVSCCSLTPSDAAGIRVPRFVGDRRDLQTDMKRLLDIVSHQLQLADEAKAAAAAGETDAEAIDG
ncbi:MAG: NitT/TauT family transport system substrate-binding protein [Verrucomicrobiales bacterium]